MSSTPRVINGWIPYLVDDVDSVLQPLLLEERVHEVEEDGQVLVSVPEGDDHGHAGAGVAVGRGVLAAGEDALKIERVQISKSERVHPNIR